MIRTGRVGQSSASAADDARDAAAAIHASNGHVRSGHIMAFPLAMLLLP
jgi:hypothetical protein